MDSSQPLWLFFFFLVITILVFTGILAHKKRSETLARIAKRFGGRLDEGDFFSYPKLRLRLHDLPAVLKYIHVGENGTHTRLNVTWPDSQLRCEVYPQRAFSGFRKLWGKEDIEIGAPEFDAAYFIEGNSKAAVRAVLSVHVQAIIRKLAAVAPGPFGNDVHVRWADGMLTITKPCQLSSFELLERFILASAELVAAATTSSTGIEFVGEVKEPDTVSSQCQICGESLTGDLVYCKSCHTPHHRDCWDYYGGCSTYACGQSKSVTDSERRRA
jgi:Prokaryotic RING finger family 1